MKQKTLLKSVFLAFFLLNAFYTKAALHASFIDTPSVGCAPTVVSFTNNSTGNPTNFYWDFGDGTILPNSIPNPQHAYTTVGSFSIIFAISDGTSVDTFRKTYVVHPSPSVNFSTNDTVGCSPLTVHFTSTINLNAPGPGHLYWNFGNGNTDSIANPNFTYTYSGTFNVTLSVINSFGCTGYINKPAYIHVLSHPGAHFFASQDTICHPNTVISFLNTTSGVAPFTYSWDFGDGTTSTANNPNHVYTTASNYNVRLIATDANGCKDSFYHPILVLNVINQFSVPPNICQDQFVYFAVTTAYPGITNYAWFINGALLQSLPSNTFYHSFSTPGIYTILLISRLKTACDDTVFQTITVNPKPFPSFTVTPSNVCPAPLTLTFTNFTPGTTNTYLWDFGDGTTSTSNAASVPHLYSSDGAYYILLTAKTALGCVDSFHVKDTIYPLNIDLTATPIEGCLPLTVNFLANATTLNYNSPSLPPMSYPNPVTSYLWVFGDGSPASSLAAPTHIYTTYGNYIATVTITTANGCTKTQAIGISVGDKPTANFTAYPTTVCLHDTVHFTNLSTPTNAHALWYFGDGSFSYSFSPTHTYNYPDSVNVMLVMNDNGCKDTMLKEHYIKVNYPKSVFSINYSCDTILKAKFTNQSLGATSVLWDFGDGTTSTNPAASLFHIYSALGSYNVKLTCWNSATGCMDTMSSMVNLIHLNVNFTSPDTAICKNTFGTLIAQISGGNATYYQWTINSIYYNLDTTVHQPTYYHLFTQVRYNDITLKVKDEHGCIDTIRKNNYMLVAKPTAGFKANPLNGCTPDFVTFIDTSYYIYGTYAVNRYWDIGIGSIINTPNSSITNTYTTSGNYDISFIATDNIGCTSDTLTKPAYIGVYHPIANFTAPITAACAGISLNFLNNSTGSGITYIWYFGDGDTSSATNPNHTYIAPGIYTVKLVVKNSFGCVDSVVKLNLITVSPRPNAAFTMNDSFAICPPLVVNFTNQSTGVASIFWNLGNGNFSQLQNPGNTYTAPGVYTIKLVITNTYGCKDTATNQVKILGYNGVLTYTPLKGCAPLNVNFNANIPSIPGLIFDFGDGTVFSTTNLTASHTYTVPGAYKPKVIMTDNKGCNATSYGLDSIKVDGIKSGFTYTPYPSCVSGLIHFKDTSVGLYSSITQHLWIFHDSTSSTLINPTYNYLGLGTYPITLITTTQTGCTDTLHSTIVFHPLPIISAGDDTTICLKDSAILMPSGGWSYVWNVSPSLSCSVCTNPYAFPTLPTVYIVTGTDQFGCKNTDSVQVSVKTKTNTIVTPNLSICNGENINLNASGATFYLWSPANTLNDAHIANPIANPIITTQYTLFSQEGKCLPDTDFVLLTVHPKPIVNAGPDLTMIAGNEIQLNAVCATTVDYLWSPAADLSCSNCANPKAAPKNTTTYTVMVRTAFNCADTDDVIVHVICDNSQVFIPNTFTPDGNGHNDIFYPHGKGLSNIKSFKIFNRWGEQVFEQYNFQLNDISKGWNGKYKEVQLPADNFVYIIEAICDTGEPIKWQGDITLLR